MRNVRIVVDPIFRFAWIFIFGGSLQNAVDLYAKKVGCEPWKVEGGRRDGHFGARRQLKCGFVWFPTKGPLANVVVHECYHCVMYVFECLMMKGPTEETEEVFAYYLEWLTEQILNNKPAKGK